MVSQGNRMIDFCGNTVSTVFQTLKSQFSYGSAIRSGERDCFFRKPQITNGKDALPFNDFLVIFHGLDDVDTLDVNFPAPRTGSECD